MIVVCKVKDRIDLTPGKRYEVIDGPDDSGFITIIDDSGEDYVYHVDNFYVEEYDAETEAAKDNGWCGSGSVASDGEEGFSHTPQEGYW